MPVRRARLAMLALALLLGCAGPADARVNTAQTIDPPAPDIGPLGGVAMAQDGTGGLVYTRTDAGRTHVFAARYEGGAWSPPQRVDLGQPYNSAWPRIAAADGGRLVVVWTQDGGEGSDILYSAALPRGATRFLAPTVIDFAIGEDRATWPSLAMHAGGSALVVYRAVRAFSSPGLPAGYISGDVRLARFDGSRWQRLGVPVNRNAATPHRLPSADNAPRVGVDARGGGVVAWQEPDDQLVDRIWARRIFSSRQGIPLLASPDGRGGADQPALAENELGRAVVAFRQLPDPRDRSSAPQVFVNQLDEASAETAGKFAGAELVAATSGGAALAVGGRDDALLAIPGDGAAMVAHRQRLGAFALAPAGLAAATLPPAVAAGVDDRGALAFVNGEDGGQSVVAQELTGAQIDESQVLGAAGGGPIRELAIAGSGRGDALVAFAQGFDNDRQIAAAVVDTAPGRFFLVLPPGWSRERRPSFSWERAPDALGRVTYTVFVDGRRVARTARTRLRLPEGALDQGAHRVRVYATDSAGQTTRADPASYRLDRQPPRVTVSARGRNGRVRISDPGGERASGPERDGSTVDWDDGATSDAVTRSASHRFKKRGRHRVSVTALDRAGNRSVVRHTIRVR